MLEALELLKHPVLLKKVMKIRGGIYNVISPLKTSVITGDEPLKSEVGNYKNINKNRSWGKAFTCAKFHVEGIIPDGYDIEKLTIIADIGGEGQLYNNDNQPTQALTNRLLTALDIFQAHKGKSLVSLANVTKDKIIDFFIDAGYNGTLPMPPYGKSRFKGVYLAEIDFSAKEFYYDYLNLVYQYISDKQSVDYKKLNDAYNLYFSGNREEAKNILSILAQSVATADFSFYAVGHSHLDLAWLWPIRETKRKSVRTFCNQINNIEKYPFYIYGASQPQQYDWIKENYPDFFAKIKQKVAENRIEIQGPMWVESDTNLASGEALVRQILYGQKFWKDNFNKVSNVCWLPDVFGYCGNLPQILKKSGVENFMTIKLSWNEVNTFPYNTFVWEGIDDSSVTVHMPTAGNYNTDGTPVCISKAIKNNKEKDVDIGLLLFGAGDGGGGASEAQLELLSRQAQYNKAVVKFAPSEKFFEELKAYVPKLPRYKGELYLEKHQGTFTTQCKVKAYNRKLEGLLQTAEAVWSANYIRYGEYPKAELEELWKEVLLYQFHDILPGSSIGRVYDECYQRYAILEEKVLSIIEAAAKRAGGENSIYNSSPMPVNKAVIKENSCYKIIGAPYSSCEQTLVKNNSIELKFSDNFMENDKIRITFADDGSFNLYDKELNVYLGNYNKITVYKDPYRYYNAWDIKANYVNKSKKYYRIKSSHTQIIGELLIREQTLVSPKGYVKQKITLRVNEKIIHTDNTALLRNKLVMLRMDNKPTFWNDEATFDIQFGNIRRSTLEDNSINKAQFEVCAHKYVDVSNSDLGVAILNDCKYGHRVKNGLISVNLIRKPIYPDKNADCGEQTFKLSIMPHKGALSQSKVIEQAYKINKDILPVSGKFEPLFHIEGDVVLETIKRGEQDGTIAIRCYEPYGNITNAKIIPSFAYSGVKETNLMEENSIDTDLNNLEFGKFELKTFVFAIK